MSKETKHKPPKKAVSKKTKHKPAKRAVNKKRKRPPPPVDYWKEKWLSLRASVRVGPSVDRIWNELLTEEERKLVEKDHSMGRDIVDIWARLRGISVSRAIIDLGMELSLISDFDRRQLLKKLREPENRTRPVLPVWDRTTYQLRLGNIIIKHVRRPNAATNVVLILDAFQKMGWPSRLHDPLPSKETLRQTSSRRLQDAIKSLNDNLNLIRFRGDGTGKGIVWERM